MFKNPVLLIVVFSSVAALAGDRSPFQPAEGQPICLKRVYTAAHLAQHPGQNLQEIHVLLNRKIHKYTDENGEISTSDWTIAEVSGRSPQRGDTLFTNQFGCEFNRKDGSAKCLIECDGGSFVLKPLKVAREAQLRVSKGYYWALFKEGFDEEKDSLDAPENTLQFQSTDRENEIYRLEVVPASECNWERPAKRISAGC